MLGVNAYPEEYVDECERSMKAQLSAYRSLVSSAGNGKAVGAALQSFDPLFFNNLTLVLDAYFVHRLRKVEGKDGNPLNEVRMLCDSMLRSQGVLNADKTIKYTPETSVLKLRIGDEIRLDEKQFLALFEAFFAETRRKFC